MTPTHSSTILYALFSILAFTLMLTPNAAAADAKREIDEQLERDLDHAVADAIKERLTPGAVVVVGDKDGILFQKAYGTQTYEANARPITLETVFDLASLSKPIGGATSVMILVDQGKISVSDRVSKYLPGMRTPDKKDITIEQLLLHRGGFVADNPLKDFADGTDKAMERIYSAKLKFEPGTDYLYSDNSFIILGKLVEAVSGKPLDQFARENIFQPLKMSDTAYNPPAAWRDRIAPTEKRDGKWIIGDVHDPRAYAMDGVAGHAGVFSTAADVARYCRMLLNHGQLDGTRILSEGTVAEMTKARCMPDGKNCRAYGFDVDTRHSSGPRGERFERGKTFGHTGYTGTSMWIDPTNELFVIVLTNRVHPDDSASITPLRRRVATIIAEALLPPRERSETAPAQ